MAHCLIDICTKSGDGFSLYIISAWKCVALAAYWLGVSIEEEERELVKSEEADVELLEDDNVKNRKPKAAPRKKRGNGGYPA